MKHSRFGGYSPAISVFTFMLLGWRHLLDPLCVVVTIKAGVVVPVLCACSDHEWQRFAVKRVGSLGHALRHCLAYLF